MKWALLLAVGVCSFSQLQPVLGQNQPLFSTPSRFGSYSPPAGACANCTAYLETKALSGDFNGDGKVDLAYVEIPNTGTGDEYIVTAFGAASGSPTQVGSPLKQCSASLLIAADLNGDGRDDL